MQAMITGFAHTLQRCGSNHLSFINSVQSLIAPNIFEVFFLIKMRKETLVLRELQKLDMMMFLSNQVRYGRL